MRTLYIEEEKEEKPKERKISINLYNMKNDFQITKYDLNKNYGSSYDKWIYLGSPERIDNWHWELLKKICPSRYFILLWKKRP